MSNDPTTSSRLRHATPWLGLLFVLVFVLNSVGGWVRLSGSGVAIPHWPVIEINGAWTLLPPLSEPGWQAMEQAWHTHQDRLKARIATGELAPANLGRQPADTAEFRRMFLTEWTHRLLAALTGLIALGVIVTVLRDAGLRRLVGVPMAVAGGLILLQAVLGGLLVEEGTATRWLFLHQANAAAIMACLLWSLLRLLDGRAETTLVPGRAFLRPLLMIAAMACWSELVIGGLLSSTKHIAQGGLPMGLFAIADLWNPRHGVLDNLHRNPEVHQWLHRWMAWGLTAVLAIGYLWSFRTPTGPRLRLALGVSGTFLATQVILGLGSAAIAERGQGYEFTALLALAHQATGMCLFLSLVLACFDMRREPSAAPVPITMPMPGRPAGGAL